MNEGGKQMNMYLLFLIALVPIVLLMVFLGVMKMPGTKACPIALAATLLLAMAVWKMPAMIALSAAGEGVALALWPIMLVIIAAIFTYNLSLHTKSMDVIKNMLTSITTDQRILALILAWGFGGFLESVAGFGTAVAIPAGIMAALGFDPLLAAVVCLVANTTPTAFGGIGLPTMTLAKIAGLDPTRLAFAAAIQTTLLSMVVPVIVVMLAGKSVKAVKGVLAVTLTACIAYSMPALLIAKFVGVELPAVIGSVICMISMIVVTKVFYKNTAARDAEKISAKQGVLAWLPYILILVFILGTSSLVPAVNKSLSSINTAVKIYQGTGAKPYVFTWIATPGTLIILAALIGGLVQGAKLGEISSVFGKTVKQMVPTGITILSIVALAKVMGYSGMINSIAKVLVVATGGAYPLVAPIIGGLGTFVTGSATSANVLFGGLQVEVAKSLGLNQYWLAAANMSGATIGKMISPQSIAIASAAVGLSGSEGKILSSALKFCVAFLVIMGITVFFGAALFTM